MVHGESISASRRVVSTARSAILLIVVSALWSLGAQDAPLTKHFEVTPGEADMAAASHVIEIGGGDGIEFNRIHSILLRADQGLVVIDQGSNALLFFDKNGRHLRTRGGAGGGPGEYRDIIAAGLLPGDSVVVVDGIQRRVTVLSPSGVFVRSFRIDAPFEGGGSTTRGLTTAAGDVVIGFSEVTTMAPRKDAIRFGERLIVFSSAGERRAGDDGLPLAGSEHFVQQVPPQMGGVAYWDLAFGRGLTVRKAGAGLAVGDGTRWAVDLRRVSDGALVRTYVIDRAVTPVRESDIAAFRTAALRGEEGSARLIAEKMASEMPYPKSIPAFKRFEVDPDGRVWLQEYAPTRVERELWLVVDPREGAARSVRMPRRFTPLAFSRERVFGVWRDDDDVQRVWVYELRAVK